MAGAAVSPGELVLLPHTVHSDAPVSVVFQYDYMGADKDAVTAKIVQLFSYVNSVSCFWLCVANVLQW